MAGSAREAVFARQAIAIDPEPEHGHFQAAQAAEQLGEFQLALNELRLAVRFSARSSRTIALRGYVLARMGRTDEAREVLKGLEALSREQYVPPSAIAIVYTGLSERLTALEWLERAYQARDVHLVRLPADPKWDPLRDDPQFCDLLKRCGFAIPQVLTTR